MPAYKYIAVRLNGKKVHGELSAPDTALLRDELRHGGLILLDAHEAAEDVRTKRLKTPEIADFCRQLAALLSSGVPLMRAMAIISQRDAKPAVRRIYESVLKRLQQGLPLSEALAQQGQAFPELLVNMMRSAENSGDLDAAALRMANHYDKNYRLQSKIKSASMYPIILLCLVVIVVAVLFAFVLPSFVPLFARMELPWATQAVMGISEFMSSYGLVLLIGLLLLIVLLQMLFKLPPLRRGLDRFKLRLPKIGRLLKTIYTSRFSRTLASLYVSGIPMIQSLVLARNTIGNAYIEAQFPAAIEKLATGRTLSQAVAGIDGFDQKLASTILVGEESGRLEHMLETTADAYDYEAMEASGRLVAMLEPVLIVLMALIVGFVIISIMMPIFNMATALEGY